MIIFHEGLPRSGKSYEAVVSRIIPALKSGRKVFSNVKGLNHPQFAQLLGIPEDEVRRLLIQLDGSHIPEIYDHVENDCLLVVDELQNFFPSDRAPLTKKMSEFVTEHGHLGIDIIVMGQDHRDCHALWKRRIDQLITFVKRDAVGRPNEYTWATFKQSSNKFVKLRSGAGKYEPQYFGLYKSHEDDVDNKATYNDDRSNIFKSKAFTLYLPLFLCIVGYAIYWLFGLFTGKSSMVKVAKPVAPISAPAPSFDATSRSSFAKNDAPAKHDIDVKQPPPPELHTPEQFLQNNLEKYRPRLVGLIENKDHTKMVAWVEFVDESNRVYERFNIPQLKAFGYDVQRKEYGLLLIRDNNQYVVTQFPIDRTRGVTTSTESSKPPTPAPVRMSSAPVHF